MTRWTSSSLVVASSAATGGLDSQVDSYSVEMLGSAWTFCGMIIRKSAWRVGGEAQDALGLLVLVGGAQLRRVVAEQVLDVEQALGVELLELDLGALAEAALDRLAVEAAARVDRARRRGRRSCRRRPTGRCRRARPRGRRSCTRRRSPWRWRGRRCSRGESSSGSSGSPAEHDVGAGEADAEARVGRALDEEAAALGAVGEGLADRAVDALAVGVLALQDRRSCRPASSCRRRPGRRPRPGCRRRRR